MDVCTGNISKIYIAKWLVTGGIGTLLTIVAVGYPILIGAFDRSPEVWEVVLAIWLHILSVILACAVSSFFSNRFLSKHYQMAGGLLLILILAITAQGLIDTLPPSSLKRIY